MTFSVPAKSGNVGGTNRATRLFLSTTTIPRLPPLVANHHYPMPPPRPPPQYRTQGESHAHDIDMDNEANDADADHDTHHQMADMAHPSGCATLITTLSTMNAQDPGNDKGRQL